MSRRFDGDESKKDEETLGSFYMGRMQPPPDTSRVMPRGLIATLVVLAFAGILWYAYPDGEGSIAAGDVPVIAADTATYKFKPDDPGGMEVRHQDSTVFNPLVRKETEQVERLLPRPEEPMDKDNALKSAEAAPAPDLPGVNEGLKLEPAGDTTTEKLEKVVPEKEQADAAPEATPATLTELATARAVETEKPAEVEPVVETPAAEEKPAVEAKKEAAKPEVKTTTIAGSGFYLQLGSFRDAKGADAEFKKMQRRFPQSLSALSSRVERTDLAAKGIWHRLYAGPLPEAKAREVCARLKSENPSGCIVRKL